MKELVITVDKKHPDYASVRSDIEEACRKIAVSNDPLAANYDLNSFFLDEQEALSASYLNDELSCFCTILKRDFYPPGSFRVFNRFWRNPKFRKDYPNKFVPAEILSLIQQQYLFAKKELSAKFIFISREKSRNLWLQHMLPKFDLVTEDSWWLTEDSYLVCANRTSPSCWQKLLYCHLVPDQHEVPLEKFTD